MLNLDDMNLSNEEYEKLKKYQYKQKQMKKQLQHNQKAVRGFGYDYKPVIFDP